MKVDFLGSTRVLQNLLGSPSLAHEARPQGGGDFQTLLGDGQVNLPASLQNTESPLPSGTPKVPSDDGVSREMARYSYQSPELLSPEFSPAELPSMEALEDGAAVKSPTVLSVRRRHAGEDVVAVQGEKTRSPAGIALEKLPQDERVEEVRALVDGAGQAHGVDPSLGMAVVAVESSFNPMALSRDGHRSKGLFQLLDSTAQTIIDRDQLGETYTHYEPQQNVDLGVRYLRYLHDLFAKGATLSNGSEVHPTANSSDLEKLAVAAFNAGEGRVAASQSTALRHGGDPSSYEAVMNYLPETTRDYVEKVLSKKQGFSLDSAPF